MENIVPLKAKPGIKLDGTVVEDDYWTDGLWTRFNNQGKPRKMGGYRRITKGLDGPVYGIHLGTASGLAYTHLGHADGIQRIDFDMNGNPAGSIVDRTPASYVSDDNTIWQFDAIYDSVSTATIILAHNGANLQNIDSETPGQLYYGSLTGTAALAEVAAAPDLSGGVCVLHPFVFVFGSDGRIAWSDAGLPLTWAGGSSNSARVTDGKIVKGLATRAGSGGTAPSGLFFSTTALLRASYTGGSDVFRFDHVANASSILSSRAVVEMDGIIYYAAVDRFMLFSGVPKEIPNQLNLSWFFDNVPCANRQYVWATKVPRHGEIWFMFPLGTTPRATHAAIYNVRLNTWYSTELPEGGRSDGLFPQIFRFPVWVGAVAEEISSTYELWHHEYRSSAVNQYNKVVDGRSDAIQANITTPDINFSATGAQGNVRLVHVEPDMTQVGDMTVTSLTRKRARAADKELSVTLNEDDDKLEGFRKEQGRYMRLKFDSNVQNGFFEMGDTLLNLGLGDPKPSPGV